MIRSEIRKVVKKRRKKKGKGVKEGERLLQGLPLNIAQACGKTWEEIIPMVEDVRREEEPEDKEGEDTEFSQSFSVLGLKEREMEKQRSVKFKLKDSKEKGGDETGITQGSISGIFKSFRKLTMSEDEDKTAKERHVNFSQSFSFGFK